MGTLRGPDLGGGGVQVQTNTQVKSLGNVHTAFQESVMMASGFMTSR